MEKDQIVTAKTTGKKLPLLGLTVALILVAIGAYTYVKRVHPRETHIHAGFVVFRDGTQVDFSGNEFMFIEPCYADGEHEDSPDDIQMEKAHLHDNIGDVVHIERTDSRWEDLFTNIRYPIPSGATGYINGIKTSDFLHRAIQPFDSLVVLLGNSDASLVSHAVTREHIEDMANKSTSCGG